MFLNRWIMDNDILEIIFNYLDWPDIMINSMLINRQPTQYHIAKKKLKYKSFHPYEMKNKLYLNAINTGSIDLCVEAILRMYMEILDCSHFDIDITRKLIYENLRIHDDKAYNRALLLRTFRRLQSWE